MTLSLSTAIIRCADLTRDHVDMRTKRIGVEVSPQGGLRVAATDGHVVALYKLPVDGCAVLGSFSVAGADFPKWGASRWHILLDAVLDGAAIAQCTAHSKAGKKTAATAKKNRRVEFSNEPAVIWTILDTFDRSHASGCVSVLEIGEIRDALELLHENVDIRLIQGGGYANCLCIVAGPMHCSTGIDVPASFVTRKLNVGVLDRALGLLEGLDGGGLTWMFPTKPLDPVVIRTACGRAEVWAMPMR